MKAKKVKHRLYDVHGRTKVYRVCNMLEVIEESYKDYLSNEASITIGLDLEQREDGGGRDDYFWGVRWGNK